MTRPDERHGDLTELSDEELIDRFRSAKSETGGADPAFTPPGDGAEDPIRVEMERRGLAPDREDVIPAEEVPGDTVVEDDA